MDDIDRLLQAAVDAPEPPVSDQIESYKTALTFVRLANAGDVHGILQLFSTLDQYEHGCVVGALSQLAVTAVHCMAEASGLSFDGVLDKMVSEVEASVRMDREQDGQQ